MLKVNYTTKLSQISDDALTELCRCTDDESINWMHMENQSIRPHQNQQLIHSRSFILRLWRADEPHLDEWHASLEDPHTEERFGFAGLEELFAFVVELCEKNIGISF